MRFTIEGKSLLLGTFAGAALVAGLGAGQDAGLEVERYEIEASESYAYVIDTATGQVWSRSENYGVLLGPKDKIAR